MAPRMTSRTRAEMIFLLAALAYLGFYGFGLVMGVYSPGEVPYLSIPALVLAVAVAIQLALGRRRAARPEGR